MNVTPPLDAKVFGQALDAAMQPFVEEGKVAGMVTLVQIGDHVVHTGCLGMRYREADAPMRPDSIFRIASMTKPITAAAVLTLVEEGVLSLDDSVSRFIPAFDTFQVLVDPSDPDGPREDLKQPITVWHLLTHTSGLAYGIFDRPLDRVYRDAQLFEVSLEEMVTRLAKLPLATQPGREWRYSIASDVLGYLIEVASGTPFDVYLEERIFGPLGMDDTGFVIPESKVDRFTALYTSPMTGKAELYDDPTMSGFLLADRPCSGGGGLVSTAQDYLDFLRMLRNEGKLGAVRILEPRTVSLMVANQLPDRLTPLPLLPFVVGDNGYGLGLGVRVGQDARPGVSSSGSYWWSGAYGTVAWVDPQKDLIGIFMTQAQSYWEPFSAFQDQVNRMTSVT
jgi:CubicO group peptidase (beta-lactamase class C family)